MELVYPFSIIDDLHHC